MTDQQSDSERDANYREGAALFNLAQGHFGNAFQCLNEVEARPLLEKAIELGYQRAEPYLASIYLNSADPQLRERGHQLLVDGAQRHDFVSLMYLHVVYRYGLHGYAVDEAEADRLQEKAWPLIGRRSQDLK